MAEQRRLARQQDRNEDSELRHGAAALLEHRTDQFAVLVGQHEARAQQAGTAVAAARILPVAERAVDLVEGGAALERGGITGRPDGIRADAGAANPPAPAVRAAPRRCCAASAALSAQMQSSQSPGPTIASRRRMLSRRSKRLHPDGRPEATRYLAFICRPR